MQMIAVQPKLTKSAKVGKGHPRKRILPVIGVIDDVVDETESNSQSSIPEGVDMEIIDGQRVYQTPAEGAKPNTVLGSVYNLWTTVSSTRIPQKIKYDENVPKMLRVLNGEGAYEMLEEIAQRNELAHLNRISRKVASFSIDPFKTLDAVDNLTMNYINWVGYCRNLKGRESQQVLFEETLFDENLSILKGGDNIALLKFSKKNRLGQEFLKYMAQHTYKA